MIIRLNSLKEFFCNQIIFVQVTIKVSLDLKNPFAFNNILTSVK